MPTVARSDFLTAKATATVPALSPRLDRRTLIASAAAALACAGFPSPVLAAGAAPRIVSLDFGLAEMLMALGIVPVGLAAAAGWEAWVNTPLPEGIVDVGGSQNANYELIVSLRPDLILMTDFSMMLKPKLDRIAPVSVRSIYQAGTAPYARSLEIMDGFAREFAREGEKQAYLASVEARFSTMRARLAGRPQRPLLLVGFLDTRHVRVFGTSGLYQAALERLGLENAWREETNYWGFATVGIERLASDEDIELVAIEPTPPDLWPVLNESPLWRRIPFVEAGHVRVIPSSLMFGGVPSALIFADLLTRSLADRSA